MKRPNVIIFNPDHFRAEALAHLGNPASVTPNLDRVAREDGVSFANCFCQNPVCSPSRCSFMSGWYPHVAGHRTMHHLMRPHEPVLLERLKREGYHVWWGGKGDLIQAQHGYEPYCHVRYFGENAKRPWLPKGNDASWRGGEKSDNYYSFFYGKLDKGQAPFYHDPDWDNVLEAVKVIKSKPQEPFCLFLALCKPDPPFAVEEPWYSMVDRGKLPPRAKPPTDWSRKPSMLKGTFERTGLKDWSEAQFDEMRAVYYGMCARIDHQYNMVLEALKESGLYDDSAVFFFSDHGIYAGDFGLPDINQNTYEDVQTNVPFVVKPPANIPCRPGIRQSLVELVDFPATVMELVGIEPDYWQFGKSLLPVISGKTESHRDAVFCEGGRLHLEQQAKELESVEAQLPGNLYWPRLSWQAGDGTEHTKAVMCRTQDYKYVMRLYEQDELYDLKEDPQEENNRIDDPTLAPVLTQLKERLLKFFLETCDAVPREGDRR
jgi:arylsulfatase A-like enzyme